MVIILLLGIVKSVFSNCSWFILVQEECFQHAVYTLFREVVVLVIGAVIVQALNYYEVLKLDKE